MSLHPIFNECCDPKSPYDIKEPFRIREYVYATDGRICVRVRLDDPSIGTPLRIPPANILDWTPPTSEELSLPEVSGSGLLECGICKGIGRVTLYSDYEITPGGTEECWECEGAGYQRDLTQEPVGTAFFARRYISLLRSHGVTKIRIKTLSSTSTPSVHTPGGYFSGEGFEGLLVGCKATGNVPK